MHQAEDVLAMMKASLGLGVNDSQRHEWGNASMVIPRAPSYLNGNFVLYTL